MNMLGIENEFNYNTVWRSPCFLRFSTPVICQVLYINQFNNQQGGKKKKGHKIKLLTVLQCVFHYYSLVIEYIWLILFVCTYFGGVTSHSLLLLLTTTELLLNASVESSQISQDILLSRMYSGLQCFSHD